MKYLLCLAFLIGCSGCGGCVPARTLSFNGKVTLEKVNSSVASVTLTFPKGLSENGAFTITDVNQIDQAIEHLESVINDLKYARGWMIQETQADIENPKEEEKKVPEKAPEKQKEPEPAKK